MQELRYDIAVSQVQETEEDCELIVRTNTAKVFYCSILPSNFVRSPQVTTQYLKCLEILRSGDEEIDDFYLEDAYGWLLQAFAPLVLQLAPEPPLPHHRRPTLSDYLFAPYFVCDLTAEDDKLRATHLQDKDHGWMSPVVNFDDAFLQDLTQWTRSYDASQVELCYDSDSDVLIKPPTRVSVHCDGAKVTCFYKRLSISFGKKHAAHELLALKKVSQSGLPPDALVCRLHGVVQSGRGLAGILLEWIPKKNVLSRALALQVSASLRSRWREQITSTLGLLHERGVVWGDAKADNVLIDDNDDAWIIDFGGSYTVG